MSLPIPPALQLALFLALRYLKPRRALLSVITAISITGVTLGVTVLILVTAVMAGFELELRRKIVGFEPHLTITSHGALSDWRKLAKRALPREHVTSVAPYVQGPVIVEFNRLCIAPNMRGMHHDFDLILTNIRKLICNGRFNLMGNNIILGLALANTLGVKVGDKVSVCSSASLHTALSELDRAHYQKNHGSSYSVLLQRLQHIIRPKSLTVVGIFQTGHYLYDSEFVLVPLHIGQELYNLGDNVHGLAVKISDPYKSGKVKEDFLHTFSTAARIDTWIEKNRALFDAIRMERNVMFFLLMFIILVAAFSIMNTLITITVQKTREIGILKALGAQTWQVVGVFIMQGMVIGLLGTMAGLGLGMCLIHYRNEVSRWVTSTLGIEVFPKDIYQFAEIPAEVIASDVCTICISAFLICALAAVLPAWFAARLDPARALRYG
ncbi:Lipoprotein-releasing system transmembrane protein LolE [Candidatus Xiphinematobacter sp. Idaho Grape]|uniref:FtsX-like permease family protein n=1 Tax=Candidatus Xiphinematobacter sp. Idaho Grape TaxID=1704307 RepID=UPI000705772B|nr:FtsX-like permease family protein [Candidatus Xiphinematobacter sp. Idaho Grape]ALJ56632.1 Lipoprotein-releasing system transmembrane protein LolE [Candidatus Xiphinematobacter sp. Idaho Grape]